MKVLLVEDTESSVKTCKDVVEECYNGIIEVVNVANPDDALNKIDSTFDAMIVDLRLEKNTQGGDFIEKLESLGVRIPTVIHTGTPDDVKPEWGALKIFSRDDCGYQDVFDYLLSIYSTGITEIAGLRGFLESQMQRFYKEAFADNVDLWIDRAKNAENRVKSSLLRMLISRLDCESFMHDENSYPEEFYVPVIDSNLYTGSVVRSKLTGQRFVVLSPACDLVIRNEKPKIKSITLCELQSIESHGFQIGNDPQLFFSNGDKKKLGALFQNSNDDKEYIRYHWLPYTKNIEGGFINFTMPISELYGIFFEMYDVETYRIAPVFVKNILSRFSSYYARQGQPDLVPEESMEKMIWIAKSKEIKP
ncbi:response regulator [Fibrobacter sp. UWH1]|uniref:response regulator n=1 Tax=Fibrobacter sp. UWH1 TaxID=1964354 RepID=UPI000B5293BD|nr:response regulator [Fibrobacter sp. UWH1]OWV14725.1 hypothetical protein B7992_07225 [Fibrobacter sp. UWH1]